MTLSEKGIEQILRLFDSAGYPQNITNFLEPQIATTIKRAYAAKEPENAYRFAQLTDDGELRNFASLEFAATNPDSAYQTACKQNDDELKQRARVQLLKCRDLSGLKELATRESDLDFLNMIGHAYLVPLTHAPLTIEDAAQAYHIGGQTKDQSLLAKARKELVSLSSQQAYELGIRQKDSELTTLASNTILETEAPLAAFIFGIKHKDLFIIRNALQRHINALHDIDDQIKGGLEEAYLTSDMCQAQKKE